MEENNTMYMQTIPNSHRYTLYGLQQELTRLTWQLKGTSETKTILAVIEHILIGIKNSIDNNEEIMRKPEQDGKQGE